MPLPPPDPVLAAEAHALRAALARFPTLETLRASPEWPALSARLEALLAGVRRFAPSTPREDPVKPGWLRVAHWNIEHGNRHGAIARALEVDPGLAEADLVTLNEVDLGMARSGNRDVAAALASLRGLHAAWAPMFLEGTRGRDDDALTALPGDNAESLFGLAVLSRWPIASARVVPLPGPERELFGRERMTGRFVGLVCEIAHPERPFVAVTAHLEVHRTRAHRAEQMRLLLAALHGERRPVVIAGDWNTHTFDRGRASSVLDAAWPLLAWPDQALADRFLHPARGAHREALFEALSGADFAWEPYNDDAPTLAMRFARLGEVHAMPWPLRPLVADGLRRFERRARLRLDWIAARGFDHAAGRGRTIPGYDGPGLASDHAPIVATLRFA